MAKSNPSRDDTIATSALAARHVTRFLKSRKSTVDITNVASARVSQKGENDLIWKKTLADGSEKDIKVEIKGDNYHKSGNYLFETKSNIEADTDGRFLYSDADYFFYYYPGIELHIIPLKKARTWFLARRGMFEYTETSTPTGKGSITTKTEGALVPRKKIQKDIKIKVIPYASSWGAEPK